MLHSIWTLLIYQPIYNALVFFATLTGGNVGLAVISMTLIVKIILYPLGKRAIITQLKTQELQPQLKEINKITDRAERGKKTIELYRKNNVSPLSSIFLLLVQLPIILALYFVIQKGIVPNSELLYGIVDFPAVVNTHFLGIFNLAERSIVLALLAGVTQYFQAVIVSPKLPKKTDSDTEDFSDALARNMSMMKYIMPVIITIFAYQLSGAVALYWAANGVFSIIQELLVRRNYSKQKAYIYEQKS